MWSLISGLHLISAGNMASTIGPSSPFCPAAAVRRSAVCFRSCYRFWPLSGNTNASSQGLRLFPILFITTSYGNPEPPGVSLISNQTYAILSEARAALVTSGTATLETALFNVPQVVCYKGSPVSFWLARRLVQVPFISLVNLIAGKPVVRELIQHECTADTMTQALRDLLDASYTSNMREEYRLLRDKLGQAGAASRTAALIMERLR
jgi:hypothetical protein